MRFVPILLSITLLPACAASTARVHPDWIARVAESRGIVVTPPEITILLPDEGDIEELEPEELLLARRELQEAAGEALTRRGYTVVQAPGDHPNVDLLHEDHRRVLEAAYRASEDVALSEGDTTVLVSMSASYQTVSRGLDGDLVLCIQVVGMKRSPGSWLGEIFTNALIDGLAAGVASGITGSPVTYYSGSVTPAFRGCAVHLTLVDRASGDLLWTDSSTSESLSTGVAKGQLKDLVQRFLAGIEEGVEDEESEADD